MSVATQLIMNGIIAGSIYALVAFGFTLVFGVLKIIHFAHGEVFMLGAYIGYVFHVLLGMNIIVALVLSMLFSSIIGVLIDRIAYKPLRRSHRMSVLIAAIAVSIFLQSLALMIFGPGVKTLRTGTIQKGIEFFGAVITPTQITIVLVSFLLMILLQLFVKKTKMGKAIRATADDLEVAQVIGIDTEKVIMVTFAIGSALAAAAGVLIGFEQNMGPTMGLAMAIKAFTATIVGGIGNIYGAVLGGFLIGLVENIGIWWLPSGYKDAIAFFVLLLFLLLRPQGILGEKVEAVR